MGRGEAEAASWRAAAPRVQRLRTKRGWILAVSCGEDTVYGHQRAAAAKGPRGFAAVDRLQQHDDPREHRIAGQLAVRHRRAWVGRLELPPAERGQARGGSCSRS